MGYSRGIIPQIYHILDIDRYRPRMPEGQLNDVPTDHTCRAFTTLTRQA